MPLWNKLYNTIWLAFFSCVLIPRWMGPYIGAPAHVLLGLALLAITQSNARTLAGLNVPPRLQRISKAAAGLSVFQLVIGLALGAITHLVPSLRFVAPVLRGVHVVCALAILAQSGYVLKVLQKAKWVMIFPFTISSAR